MSIGRTNSGSGNFYAVLGISYPPGSTCTCTDSNNKIMLEDITKSGRWVCPIPNNGKWTVHVTDGVNEVGRDVEINTKGQVANIDIKYELVLLDNGYENVDIIGEWTGSGIEDPYESIVKDDYISLSLTSSYSNGLYHTGGGFIIHSIPINLSNMDRINLDFNYAITSTASHGTINRAIIELGITSHPELLSQYTVKSVTYDAGRLSTDGNVYKEEVLDLSDIPPGEYYIYSRGEIQKSSSTSNDTATLLLNIVSIKAKYKNKIVISDDLLPETKSALQLVYDSLGEASQNQVVAVEEVKDLFDRYGVDY